MARISEMILADNRFRHARRLRRGAARDLRHSAQGLGNDIDLTITRDVELEAALEFKKAKMDWRPVRIWVCADKPEENRRMKRKLRRAGLRFSDFPVAVDFVASHPAFSAYVNFFAAKKSADRALQEAKQEKADISIRLQSAERVIVTSPTELQYFLDVSLYQGWNDKRRIHVPKTEVVEDHATVISVNAITAGLSFSYG